LITDSTHRMMHKHASLAPRWHTVALVTLQLAVALTGTVLQHYGAPTSSARAAPPATAARISTQYLPLLIVNWGLLAYCCRLFRGQNALPRLLGERWRGLWRACADLALALATAFVILALDLVSRQLLPMGRNAAIAGLLPSTGAERLVWIVVAVNVGFCEEVAYRGYLQTQLAAFTGRPAAGVALQAALFGIAHLEQGPIAALTIALSGLALGVLAHFRRSLLPGIACHIGIDLASGLFR